MILSSLYSLFGQSPAQRDARIRVPLIAAAAINVVLWVVFAWLYTFSAEYVIVRYTIYFGISALVPGYQMLQVPLIGLVVLLVNAWLSFKLYLSSRQFSYLIAGMALVVNLVLMVAAGILIYLNS